MKKYAIEIKWAFIHAAMFLVWMILESVLGFHSMRLEQQQVVTTLILIPFLLIYVLALLDKRKNHFKGVMTYKQSFVSGTVLTVLIVILSPINQLLVSYIISPDYFKDVTAYTVSKGLLTQEEAARQFNIGNYIITSIVGGLVTGLVFASILSLFTKTKNKLSYVQ